MAPSSYSIAKNEAAVDRENLEKLLAKLNSIQWREPRVAMLVETPRPHRHAVREEVDVVEGRGFAGDHAEKSFYRGEHVPGREVSAMAREVLDVLEVDPSVVGDNLITEGIDLAMLEEGTEVKIGEVILERSWKNHRPCIPFRNRTSPEAFAAVAQLDMRGALFVVRKGGRIRQGDPIVLPPARSSAEKVS